MNIDQKYTGDVSTQSYAPRPKIAGVELLRLTYHQDDGGNFAELYRLENGAVSGFATPFTAKQVSISVLVPGTIKAYHLHYKQDDVWFVPPSHRLLVNLHDVREGSESFDIHQRVVLGAQAATLLRIPAGVAHGVANVYDQEMILFYATSEQFSQESPDEQRLPWDLFGAEKWELIKG